MSRQILNPFRNARLGGGEDAADGAPHRVSFLKRLMQTEASVLIMLVVLCAVMAFLSPHFLSLMNIMNILQRAAVVGIIALGMTFVIMTGGIDLSVGGQVLLVGIFGASMLVADHAIWYVVILMVLLGGAIGSINGLAISALNLPPFIMTMAMLYVTRGLSLYFTEGRTVFGLPREYGVFGLERTLGVPNPILIYAALFIACLVLLRYTTFGRTVVAVGDNRKASWLSGIRTRRVLFWVYVLQGALAAVSAIILTSRLSSAPGTMGNLLELDVIGAVVIGGTSLFGGQGTILGSVVGALIITIVGNAMNLLAVSPFLHEVVKGAIIIFAVLVDLWRKGDLFAAESK